MDEEILKLLGRADYAPANVPELLRLLRWPPNRQQQLQQTLRRLEQTGRITRTKGNRYIQSHEADLVAGRIRINRQGKGFLIPDDASLKEIMVPESEIIEVLGSPDEEGVDMLSVLRQYSLPLHFPKNVLQEARAIGSTVQPNELAGREDCRGHDVVTIDPDDAKDFDDAICLQRL